MDKVVAVVGRPNVGKSTLFNRLTKSRDALVMDLPGVTRDRLYGRFEHGGQSFLLIDTGGLSGEVEQVDQLMATQTQLALDEANLVIFMVDGRSGLTPSDEEIAQQLRASNKPMILLVNKIDGLDEQVVLSDFYGLGFEHMLGVSVSHNRGMNRLRDMLLEPEVAKTQVKPDPEPELGMDSIKFALVGRPNTGKSTLANRILGEERVVVLDMPGTTRDSIYLPFERRGKVYTLIDTAGVRRRGRVKQTIEKFSVVKTLKAIDDADVAILLIDAQEGVTDQDLHLMTSVLDAGTALVVALNKWDNLSDEKKDAADRGISRQLGFIRDFVKIHKISALHGTGVGDLFSSLERAYQSATLNMTTQIVNQILKQAVDSHPPPMVNGRRIKLNYAHCGGHQPPTIIIHGRQVDQLPKSYQTYLVKRFRHHFKMQGTPIRIHFHASANPFVK